METNNFIHLGAELVVANMMIHSVSPQARRLVEQMYTTDNPFNINIMLDSDSKNRSAEIVNTLLKTIGRRLVFEKKLKKIRKITYSPISFGEDPVRYPISFIPQQLRGNFDVEKDFADRQKLYSKMKKKGARSPLSFEGVNTREDWDQE